MLSVTRSGGTGVPAFTADTEYAVDSVTDSGDQPEYPAAPGRAAPRVTAAEFDAVAFADNLHAVADCTDKTVVPAATPVPDTDLPTSSDENVPAGAPVQVAAPDVLVRAETVRGSVLLPATICYSCAIDAAAKRFTVRMR